MANGIDEDEVQTTYSIKSISTERTFEEDVADRTKVLEALDSMVEEVHERTLSQNMVFRTVGIKVRHEDFTTYTRAKSHTRYTDEKFVMREFVRELFNEFEDSRKKIRLIGVRVSNLKPADKAQETILSWTDSRS